MADVIVDLNPLQYQSSLSAFRNMVEGSAKPFLIVEVRTPAGTSVEIQVRTKNVYLAAFHGKDDWYYFEDEHGALGKPLGISSNYSKLGKVGSVTYDDLKAIGTLAEFEKRKGSVDTRIIAILIGVVCEAARFATVATYFTGLTNSVGTSHSQHLLGIDIDFEALKKKYFNQWQKPPEDPTEPGSVFTSIKRDIILPHR